MFVTIVLASLTLRYYLLQREEVNAIALRLRDDVSGDVLAAYNAAYGAGVKTRAFYEEYAPKVSAAYADLRAKVHARLSR